MATVNIAYGTDVQMTVTNLNSQANSATAAWLSDRVDNTSTKAMDYQVNFSIDFDATAAANDKALYFYVVPWFWDGSAFTCGADGGTTTLPGATEADYTIGATHNLRLAKVATYTATGQVVCGSFNVLDACGSSLPDAWSLIVVNFTGAAIAASANVIQYKPITYTVA